MKAGFLAFQDSSFQTGDGTMAKPMIASKPMTDGQFEDAVDKFRDALRKIRAELASEPAQLVLGIPNIGMKMVQDFRDRVEASSKIITRTASVNRSRTNEDTIAATNRTRYVNAEVVKTMPRGTGDKATTEFFKPDLPAKGYFTDDELEQEFELRGMEPEFPDNLAAVNEADPAFADTHPNATHWKDENGKWCYVIFGRWDGERSVSVDRNDRYWFGSWWFAGRRKSALGA